MASVQKLLNASFDAYFTEQGFWYFDASGKKLMSGFLNSLLLDSHKNVGLVLRYYLNQKRGLIAKDDKELAALALIVSQAFALKEVVVTSIWIEPVAFSSFTHSNQTLQDFKQILDPLLKKRLL